MRFTTFTNKGSRENNTDAVLRIIDGDACAFIVIDGGEFCGDIASHIIMEAIQNELKSGIRVNDALIKKCIKAASETLKAECTREDGFKKVKASCAMLITDGRRVVWGHIGNCRIYRLRNGKIKEISNDHTSAYKEFVDKKIPFSEVAKKDEWPPLVSISYDNDLDADVSKTKSLFFEYSFIVCSDGFWKNISSDEIEQSTKMYENTKNCICKMIDHIEANCGSECDSVSVIMVNM